MPAVERRLTGLSEQVRPQGKARGVQGRISGQHGLLQALQLGRGLDAELADERVPELAEGLERAGYVPGAVKRGDELR